VYRGWLTGTSPRVVEAPTLRSQVANDIPFGTVSSTTVSCVASVWLAPKFQPMIGFQFATP
jgi:hypothetical protein